MVTESDIERADRTSRARAILFAIMVVPFAAATVLDAHLFFRDVPPGSDDAFSRWVWFAMAALYTLLMLTLGFGPRRILRLVNDELTRRHHALAMRLGFSTMLVTALGILVIPQASTITAAGSAYAVLSTGLFVSLVVFAVLELRALADA